jgi:hypothetical protein
MTVSSVGAKKVKERLLDQQKNLNGRQSGRTTTTRRNELQPRQLRYSGTRNIVILWTLVDNFFYSQSVSNVQLS